MKADKTMRYIGLAARAGKAPSGEVPVESAVRSGKAALVIIAADASERSKKKFKDMCTYRGVPAYELYSMDALGEITGKSRRAAVAITEANLAGAIIKSLNS